MRDPLLPTPSDPVATLVFFLLVFTVVAVVFLFMHLMMGSVIRPNRPDAEKLTIYECGEPTVGSAWVQFDLRFYVVALLFVIFDVEVAFFFPWAVVFGKANALSNPNLAAEQRVPQRLLQPLEPPADRRLPHQQLLRRRAQAAGLRDRQEELHVIPGDIHFCMAPC